MSISTISFNSAARSQIMRVEAQLRDALVETGGRHADVGRTLGRLTANTVSLRAQETSLDRLLQSNKLVTQRLSLADDTLEAVAKTAEGLQSQLITGLANDDFLHSAKQVAASALDQLTASANLSVGGQYLFAGANTDVRPLNGYGATIPDSNPATTPKAEVEKHFKDFLDAAGATAATVSAEDLAAYFGDGYAQTVVDEDGVESVVHHRFDDLFTPAADGGRWNEIWSGASDETITARISKSETIDGSVSANEKAFRDLVAGYVMLDLASADMNEGARNALAGAAQAKIGSGFSEVTGLRADLGNRISRVEAADTSLTQQKDIVNNSIGALENVDLAEAANRLAALQTQYEATLRATQLIRQMNILDYL